ncbi:MAG: hypothetical protein ACE15B_07250 [Bryobacteraceae bacterium]
MLCFRHVRSQAFSGGLPALPGAFARGAAQPVRFAARMTGLMRAAHTPYSTPAVRDQLEL